MWALPFLTVLAPSRRYHEARGRRHKTITDWARQMLCLLRRWLPDRELVVVGDRTYATLRLLAACQDMDPPITFLARLRLDAVLHAPPPPSRLVCQDRPHLRRCSGRRPPRPLDAGSAIFPVSGHPRHPQTAPAAARTAPGRPLLLGLTRSPTLSAHPDFVQSPAQEMSDELSHCFNLVEASSDTVYTLGRSPGGPCTTAEPDAVGLVPTLLWDTMRKDRYGWGPPVRGRRDPTVPGEDGWSRCPPRAWWIRGFRTEAGAHKGVRLPVQAVACAGRPDARRCPYRSRINETETVSGLHRGLVI